MNNDSITALQIRKDSDITIDTSIIQMSFNEIFNIFQEQFPDLKIANYQLQSAKKSLAIVRGQNHYIVLIPRGILIYQLILCQQLLIH